MRYAFDVNDGIGKRARGVGKCILCAQVHIVIATQTHTHTHRMQLQTDSSPNMPYRLRLNGRNANESRLQQWGALKLNLYPIKLIITFSLIETF